MFDFLHGAGRALRDLLLDGCQPFPRRVDALFKPRHRSGQRLFDRALLQLGQLPPHLHQLRRYPVKLPAHSVHIGDQLGKLLCPVALHLGQQRQQLFHVAVVDQRRGGLRRLHFLCHKSKPPLCVVLRLPLFLRLGRHNAVKLGVLGEMVYKRNDGVAVE